jgi:hypothetical protein
LKSPLADALTLAAACQVNASVRLLVAGPGLDGELPPDELRPLLGAVVHTFTARDVEAVSGVLDWHPSEAVAMLAATARGVRGVCEVRGAGMPVALTDEGPRVHAVDLDEAVNRNRLARAIMTTAALDEVEAYSREIGGFSEIDHERDQAARLSEEPSGEIDADVVSAQLERFEVEARRRGVTHTTFRRLTEALALPGSQREPLRRLVVDSRPEQYEAPLWRITATSE